jgi:hypothetical protein
MLNHSVQTASPAIGVGYLRIMALSASRMYLRRQNFSRADLLN